MENIFVHNTIIGGGPAGTGTILKSMKDGIFDEYVADGLAIVEKSSSLILGMISAYHVNSDTVADVFLECLEGKTKTYLNIQHLSDEIRMVEEFKGCAIPLNKLKPYLSKLSVLLKGVLERHPQCRLFLNNSATSIIQEADGRYTITLSNGTKINTQNIILASGGTAKRLDLKFANKIELSDFYSKSISSDCVLKTKNEAIFNTFRSKKPKILVLGGNHSAFSVADYILKNQELNFDENPIVIWSTSKPKIFYMSVDEAKMDGYHDFDERDICPKTKRVYRLAGLRMDGRQLFRSISGLDNQLTKVNVEYKLFREEESELKKDLQEADIIIHAFGYHFNMIPLFDKSGSQIKLLGSETGYWVNPNCCLLDINHRPIENVYAMGLASGFVPSGDLGGEPSFKGQTNGLWLYQNDIADLIIKNIVTKSP